MDNNAEILRLLRQHITAARASEAALVERLEGVRLELSKYENALAVLTELPDLPRIGGNGGGVRRAVLSLKGMKVKDAAKEVLHLAGGGPMRNREIADAMVEHGYEYDKKITQLRDTVNVVLTRQIEIGDTDIHKTADGQWMLLNDDPDESE